MFTNTLVNVFPSIFYVLYLLLPVCLQTGGVVIPLGVAAPGVQNAAVVGVEPQASFDIALAFDVLVPASVVAV
jgi:hypothetical protein